MSVCWDGFGARWGRLRVVRRRRLACGPGGGSFSGSGVVGGGGMACAVGGGSSWFRGRCFGEWRGGSLFFLSCGGLGGGAFSGVGVVGAGFGCALFWREGVFRGGVGMTVCLDGFGARWGRLRVVRRRRSVRGPGGGSFLDWALGGSGSWMRVVGGRGGSRGGVGMSVCWDGFGARWGRLRVVRRRRLACGPGGGSFSGSGVVGGGGMACAVGGGSSWFRGRCRRECWSGGVRGARAVVYGREGRVGVASLSGGVGRWFRIRGGWRRRDGARRWREGELVAGAAPA